MEILAKRRDLQEHLRRAQSVADKKSTMPVLANVLVQTSGDDAALICATDHVVSFSATAPCTVNEGGGFCADAAEFASIVDGMPGDDIKVTVKDGGVTVRSGRARYTLRSFAVEHYPPLPDFSEAEFYKVDAKLFWTMLNKSMFSVCDDTVRYHLNGVFYESDGDRIRMVSTDGHRLTKIEANQEGKRSEGVIVPKKGLTEIRRVLSGADEAWIAVEPPMFFVGVDETRTVLGVKLIDAQFPPYAGVIPTNNDKIVRMDRKAALGAFRRIQFAATELHGVKVHLSENLIRLAGRNPQLGTAEEALDVHYSGEELALHLNPSLVADYLSGMEGEEVIMSFSTNMAQIMIHPADNTEYLGVVMPMQPS